VRSSVKPASACNMLSSSPRGIAAAFEARGSKTRAAQGDAAESSQGAVICARACRREECP
jgi:hypothetical protein